MGSKEDLADALERDLSHGRALPDPAEPGSDFFIWVFNKGYFAFGFSKPKQHL